MVEKSEIINEMLCTPAKVSRMKAIKIMSFALSQKLFNNLCNLRRKIFGNGFSAEIVDFHGKLHISLHDYLLDSAYF